MCWQTVPSAIGLDDLGSPPTLDCFHVPVSWSGAGWNAMEAAREPSFSGQTRYRERWEQLGAANRLGGKHQGMRLPENGAFTRI